MKDSLNERLFDLAVEEAVAQCAADMENNPPEVPEDVMAEFEASKGELFERIQKNIKKEKRAAAFSAKKAVILAAALVIVLAAAFNASAIKSFVYKTYTEATDKFLNIKIEKAYKQQYEDITRFVHKDELIIPGWLPEDMQLVEVVDEEDCVALNFKSADEAFLRLNIEIFSDAGNPNVIIENNKWETWESTILGMYATNVKVVTQSEKYNYKTYFYSNNVSYSLSSNLTFDEYEKIINSLNFLK